jgi:hypothetical protein
MAKKLINKQEIYIPNPELNKTYIYVRNWKLLYPIPYIFKLDIKKIIEFKKQNGIHRI